MVGLIIFGLLLLAGCVWLVIYCFKHAKEQRIYGVIGSFILLTILGCLAVAIYFTVVDKPAVKKGGPKIISIQR